MIALPAWWVSHAAEDWHFDWLRQFVEGLAAGRMVVRYDRVGTGMSDRERPRQTFTPEFELATLSAVLDELGLARVTLMGISCGGCTAVSFAARWPKRVDRLVLYGSYADGHGLASPQARRGMVDRVRSHGLGNRLLADVFGPSWSPEDRAAFTAAQACVCRALGMPQTCLSSSTRPTCATICRRACAGMVVHRERDHAMRPRGAREVAPLLPQAELVTLPGDAHLPWHAHGDVVLRAIAPFLGIRHHPSR